ncbi:RNase adapter RapZ [Peptococcaceae bacterium]|nr:RNase adapter RapZ [Peptococcaceae bacterium]
MADKISKILIISGLLGAGKTTAVRILEDMGFFIIDNLPPALVTEFVELCKRTRDKLHTQKIAIVIDVRAGKFLNEVFDALNELKKRGIAYEILFLEASEDVLVSRYKESRRRHPLFGAEILEDIRQERMLLSEIRGHADKIIDTSSLSTKQLREELQNIYSDEQYDMGLFITVVSFGFKYGIPLDADIVWDVRFLSNPYYVNELRALSGNDKEVIQFMRKPNTTAEFLEKFSDILEFVIPNYEKEGKSALTIAVGCTGGRHRSVFIANSIDEFLKSKNYKCAVRHRDLAREMSNY